MTALATLPRPRLGLDRRFAAGLALLMLGLIDVLVFGVGAGGRTAHFMLSSPDQGYHLPTVVLPVAPVADVAAAVAVAAGALWATARLPRWARRAGVTLAMLTFVLAFLCWSDAGRVPLPVVGLLENTVDSSIPLVLGALAGVLCERSGVINIAIEGQLLLGAFVAAIVGSVAALWLGILTGAVAGGLLGALLAVFAIRYAVDQIVLGVVLNVFASGLTGYLYDRALVPYQNTLNSPSTFGNVRVPVLVDIPILGPVLFDSTVFLYLSYAILALVQVGLFHTRWGLRVRAVGEHPTAADTVGIRVLATRYRNVIMGGIVAGVGGAYLTIGSVGAFGKDISSGKGYIALAAMIFGRWTPLGAVGAALLFGFATALADVLGSVGAPIPSDFLLMLPYLATIIAVAGLVGRVRAPQADGQPYLPS